jgi:hypothetical protein
LATPQKIFETQRSQERRIRKELERRNLRELGKYNLVSKGANKTGIGTKMRLALDWDLAGRDVRAYQGFLSDIDRS